MSWQFNESVFSCLNFVFPDIYKLPTTDHFCCQQRFDREPDIPWNSPDSYCRYLPFHYQQSFTEDIILNNFGRCLNIIDCFFFYVHLSNKHAARQKYIRWSFSTMAAYNCSRDIHVLLYYFFGTNLARLPHIYHWYMYMYVRYEFKCLHDLSKHIFYHWLF